MGINYIYQTQEIGVKLLCEQELCGEYPSWFQDLRVCEFNRHIAFSQTLSECKQYIEQHRNGRSALVWAVYHLSDSIHIGNISLQNIDWINRSGELAFLFGAKKYWSKGYAAQAAQLLLNHTFRYLNLNRVHCGTAACNTRMLGLAEKLNFRKEGERKEALFINGKYHHLIEFGITASEWHKQP